jgi:hypothetical protein
LNFENFAGTKNAVVTFHTPARISTKLVYSGTMFMSAVAPVAVCGSTVTLVLLPVGS